MRRFGPVAHPAAPLLVAAVCDHLGMTPDEFRLTHYLPHATPKARSLARALIAHVASASLHMLDREIAALIGCREVSVAAICRRALADQTVRAELVAFIADRRRAARALPPAKLAA